MSDPSTSAAGHEPEREPARESQRELHGHGRRRDSTSPPRGFAAAPRTAPRTAARGLAAADWQAADPAIARWEDDGGLVVPTPPMTPARRASGLDRPDT
jgi:hypothetical protein